MWYDNDTSLALKYDLAINKKLGGVGIWALGYDDGRTELWKVIEEKLAKPTNIAEREVPTQARLYQNYPNPFNPETTISYTVQAVSKVNLKVYDVLGKEVATLVNEYKQPGNYKTNFNVETRHGASLQSGVFFYTFKANGFIQTKKMLLVK
ncbi:MAG: T9SS C-terminal target domain-containing protein [Stygiobacter sp.]|nr:MAG: T9SS C-terminal target domain-containing protein [Stygiobacter sp.]